MNLKPIFTFFSILLFSLGSSGQTAYFPVKVNGLWGLINVQGKLVVKPNYRYIPFEVSPGQFYVTDTNYNEIIIGRNGIFLDSSRYEEDTPWSATDGPGLKYKEGYTDQYGKVIFKLTDTVVEALPFENGLARIITQGPYPQYDWDDNAGYIDKTGKFVIPPVYGKFDLDDYFEEELIRFESGTYEGFLNKKGDTVIPPLYDRILDFSEGFAAVEIDNKHNFIDKKGKIISDAWYESVNDFSDGLAVVGNYSDPLPDEYMNMKGEIAFRLDTNVFDSYRRYDFHEGLACIELKNKTMVYIDKTGKIVLPGPFHTAGNFSEGCASVWDTNGVYFIDKTGKAITQQRFDDADDFSNGLAAVFIGEDVGHIGTGCVIAGTSYRFHSGSLFTGDLKMGYINKQGIVVWKPTN